MLTEIDLAYIAGLVDGEGCISLEPPKKLRQGKFQSGRARIIVSMTTPDVLRWLKENCGGTFYERKKRAVNQQPIFTWCLSGATVGHLLADLLPHMRVKHEQAKNAIEFLAVMKPPQWRLTDDYRERLIELVERNHELNRRGPS